MEAYLKRLAASGLAYQSASLLSGFLALFTLPLYTRHISRAGFGYAETLLTLVILASIILRFGMGEAFLRTWFDDDHPGRRRHLARTTTTFVLLTTTCALLAGILLAGPLSQLVLGRRDATLMAYAVFGIWAFTNLEVAYALLRVEERRRAYLTASAVNVILTVITTVVLVVILHRGARGYLLGNYAASAVVLVGLWVFAVREHIGLPQARVALGPLMRFGAPTVPADAAVFLLNVVDRAYLLRVSSPASAGLYSVAIKLATVVIVLVRGFQLAWPPLVYSVSDDAEVTRVYARVTTTYIVFTGLIVAGFVLLGRWVVRLLAAPAFFGAHRALPWVALGWALYGLYLVLVSIAGRRKATIRTLPAALIGLAVNVGVLIWLVPSLGIRGAAISLCVAYAAMLIALHLLTRRILHVPFEWPRIGAAIVILGGLSLAGNLLLPTAGVAGLVERALVLVLIAGALIAARVVTTDELRRLRTLVRARRAAPEPS